jgi:hypothetical protein
MTRRVRLAGSRAQAAARDGVGAALREVFEITDEGDTRMRELLDQLRRIQGREPDGPSAA